MNLESLRLPADLMTFLRGRGKLAYDTTLCECGKVTLLPLSKLKSATIVVQPEEPDDSLLDPHGEEDGAYGTSAVNLVAEAENYDPEYMLSWLPDLGMFASYDIDHGVLHIFPGVTWTQIAADPLAYLNAQWRPAGQAPGGKIKPWEHLAFMADWYGDEEE